MSSEYDIFGFRERLHGHNYQISVKVVGGDILSDDGYLIDFGDIKKAARSLCKSMNEYFILPMNSDVMKIDVEETQICLTCEDGAKFSFPKTDCIQLPLMHSSAEELSHYLWCEIVRRIGIDDLRSRGIRSVEVSVAEATNQIASFRSGVPENEAAFERVSAVKFRSNPQHCFDDDT